LDTWTSEEKSLPRSFFYFCAKSANPLRFAEPLKNTSLGQYRFRIGDYRVIFDVAQDKIVILTLGHRKDIYK